MIRKITRAAVIGAGIMGRGIAAHLASAGIRTLLYDMVPADVKEAGKSDTAARNRLAKAGLDSALAAAPPLFMDPADADRVKLCNLEDDLDRLSTCDWIVEAVVENLKIKQALLKRIETVRRPDTVVSTNTSGIPLKSMSRGLGQDFQEYFLGMHFFNPVRYMKLIEIIPGKATRPDIIGFMADFAQYRLGKGVVQAKDTPSFIGNRIGLHAMILAIRVMLAEGLTIPEVDALFGPVMGRPKTAMFKTADLVGLDTLGQIAGHTHDLVPHDESRDCFILPDFVQQMIQKNLLGQKTRAGFYKTELTRDGKVLRKVINPETLEYEPYDTPAFDCLLAAGKAESLPDKMKTVVFGQDKGARYAWKVLASHLIYAAGRIPEIAATVLEADNAMKWGYNFQMGPFETWDAIGLEPSVRKMRQDGFVVPDNVNQMLASGHSSFYRVQKNKTLFYDFTTRDYRPAPVNRNVIDLKRLKRNNKVVNTCRSASLIDLGDGVWCIEFHTRFNLIQEEIVDFIQESFDYARRNAAGIVIGSQTGDVPGAFSAGGDLKYMAALAGEKKYAQMEAFVRKGQEGIQTARYSSLPVVAAPYGMALGGGCEVCLGADRIVAHAELYMGLVEIGVGLLPAGGGCLNLWKKFLCTLPATVAKVDLAKLFVPVFTSISLARVSASAADARKNGFLGPRDRIVFNRDFLIGEAKKEVLRMIADGYAPPVKRKIQVMGQAAQGLVEAELHNMLEGKFITEYDAFLARRIAFVIAGGDVRDNSQVDEEVILALEREAFIDFWQEEKTLARVKHMLETGKPLRN
ncbi:MAG: 3-hydroxyacyl-CoA dehydrogenase NAD-binding domain-containing protein [Desulfobacterales bacterium]|nr:3-hydroxyacyl-CoA dehydrogenase NAD-binding domain-containing protein [Desulfobacterales bacterium]